MTRKEAMEGFTTELLAGEGWQATLGALAVDGSAAHSFVLKYATPTPCRLDEEDPVLLRKHSHGHASPMVRPTAKGF